MGAGIEAPRFFNWFLGFLFLPRTPRCKEQPCCKRKCGLYSGVAERVHNASPLPFKSSGHYYCKNSRLGKERGVM